MTRRIALCLLPVLFALGCGPGTAGATVAVSTTVFDFTGQCSDCIGTGTAELTLANYTLGTNITSANFLSFHYDGSNLLAAYTIDSTDLSSINGTISAPFPEAENVTLFGDSYRSQFITSSTGRWCTGPNCASDRGTVSSYTEASAITPTGAVPEPMSAALMGGGLLAALAVRRRSR